MIEIKNLLLYLIKFIIREIKNLLLHLIKFIIPKAKNLLLYLVKFITVRKQRLFVMKILIERLSIVNTFLKNQINRISHRMDR